MSYEYRKTLSKHKNGLLSQRDRQESDVKLTKSCEFKMIFPSFQKTKTGMGVC